MAEVGVEVVAEVGVEEAEVAEVAKVAVEAMEVTESEEAVLAVLVEEKRPAAHLDSAESAVCAAMPALLIARAAPGGA